MALVTGRSSDRNDLRAVLKGDPADLYGIYIHGRSFLYGAARGPFRAVTQKKALRRRDARHLRAFGRESWVYLVNFNAR